MLFTKPPSLASRLPHSWQSRNWLALLLLPISWVYGLLVWCRRLAYQRGWMASERLPVPVIVVGNLVAGGAGKTPTVIAIVRHLERRGFRVGVISRGYGRSDRTIATVTAQSDASQVGDEPLLLHRVTGAPVMVGARRVDAARALLQQTPDIQVLVSDDGLQHYALHRDLEVCVFDDRGIGNGWLLPSGPLREPASAAPIQGAGQTGGNRLVLHTGTRPRVDVAAGLTFQTRRDLAHEVVDQNGQRLPISTLAEDARPLMALAGIARPQAFFGMLAAQNLPLARTLPLPDHHRFDASIIEATRGFRVICTEKDAVKLWPWVPDALAVPLVQDIPPEFWAALERLLPTPAAPPG